MKRKIFLFGAFLGLVVFFNSCDKDITSTAVVIDTGKTGTLKVYLKADLDTNLNNDVADGTVVNISIKNSDLNPSFNGDANWTASGSTTSGAVEFTSVPTVDNGVDVMVDVVSFEHSYILNDSVTLKRVYDLATATTSVLPGGNRVVSYTMTPTLIERIEK